MKNPVAHFFCRDFPRLFVRAKNYSCVCSEKNRASRTNHPMKEITQNLRTPVKLLLALCACTIGPSALRAGILYSDPSGGWAYKYDGQWLNPGVGSKPVQTLDLTWSANNGSSEWDGSARGAGNGQPGGISTNNGILTIEDIDIGSGSLNNRKVYFTHDLAQEAAKLTSPGTILDTGVTITFRARLTQPDVQPPAENAVPDGWGIFSDGKGMLGLHQLSGSVHSIISFSLVRAAEPDNQFVFPAAGLTFNRLNGNVPTGSGAVNSLGANSAGNPVLPLDPNVFHEFWITIRTNQFPGVSNGTHTVTFYLDGSTTPA